MKRLLRGGRVVDPANGVDGTFDVLIDGDRISRVGRDLPVEDGAQVIEVPRRLCRSARPHRHARASARAGAGAQGDDRHRCPIGRGRRIHRHGLHAQHDAGERQREHHRADAQEGRRGQSGTGLSDWRGVARQPGRTARRHRRTAQRRLLRDLRRRQARGDGAAHAPGAGVRVHVRHAGHRPLRGRLAERRWRRARGVCRLDPGAARAARGCRDRDGAARRDAGRAHRRPLPSRTHERARGVAGRARGQGPGICGHL